ncbi:MAG: tetratricopeptide repeat protein [Planctomycetaceae bacterium]|nr:tetratricopeptide repeat protein [Planctomycetaceae bacterium]
MSRKFRLVLAVVSALILIGAWWFFASPSRPNILFVTLDTTRADRLGCYGHAAAVTPHLDALAKRGVVFERAYAPAPMTSPSHTSMFTGLWPPEHGVFTNGQVALETGIPTVAELLQQRGYQTAAFVAAFVLEAKFGLNRGFQVYDDDLSTAADGGDILHRYRDGRVVVDSAVRWLKDRQSSAPPFFCWVHLYDPHDPYLAHPHEFGDTFDDRRYDGELAYADRQVGRLFAALDQAGLTQSTIIVVVGDHGESLGEHGEETHGYMLHESTLRVPLIMAGPRCPAGGHRHPTPVSLVDLFPTLLGWGGAKVPAGTSGRSLQPALEGKSLEPRTCYSQTEEPYFQAYWSPLRGLTTERWRYVRTTKPELYDLTADPRELINLADQLPDQVSELDGELTVFEQQFSRRTGAQVALSAAEQRAIESLGYTGGSSGSASAADGDQPLPDIKDMIGYLNQLQQATELIHQEKFADAAVLLEPLAQDVPNFLRARLNLGLCLIQLGQFERAAPWGEAALQIDPNSDRAHELAGFAHLKLRHLDRAADHFQRLLELRPDSENGHLYLGEVYQRQQRFRLAMRHYAEVLRINPQNLLAREALTSLQSAGIRP